MSPTWLANAWTNAFSVEVFVSYGELAKSASTRCATSADRRGSSTRMMYQPTRPSPNAAFSQRYWLWKKNWFVSTPSRSPSKIPSIVNSQTPLWKIVP